LKATGALHLKSSNLFPGVVSIFLPETPFRYIRITVFMWLNHSQYKIGYLTRNFSMCVAVPAEVIEIKEGNIGLVDYGELRQEVRLDLVDVKVGEFVLVHVGFAIQRLSREEGLETREIFRQVYEALDN
jgi:hydrogenase expression/formation protein HypC